MKESGCYKLNLAFESGNQYVLDNIIKKPLKLERAKQLIRYAQRIGLDVGIYLIMGMPGETKEQIWESFHLAKGLGIYAPFISIATPYPGTELYDVCVEKKYLSNDFSLDDLFIRSFSISTEHWTGEELRETLRQGKRFLLRSDLRKHPFKYIGLFFKGIFTHPRRLNRKIFYLVTGW